MTDGCGWRLPRRRVLQGLGGAGLVAMARGFPAIAAAGPIRIGALLPLSGGADAIARQMQIGIEAAVAEINGTGGILGRQIEVAWRDAQTAPAVLPDLCRELVEGWGAVAIVGPWVAAGRRYPNQVLAELGVAQLYAANNEGEHCHPNLFVLGPTTAQDGRLLVEHLDRAGAGKTYFMLGSYPSWQNAMFRQLRFVIGPLGGRVAGQALTDVGERNYRPIIRWIRETDAEIVLFCVLRQDGQAFIHQARELGLLERVTVGWIGCNETLIDGLSEQELAPIVTATTFAAADPQPGVAEFVARMRRQHGREVPVSYLAMTHYNAIKALQAAWQSAGETSAKAALAGLAGLTFEGPSGPVTIDPTSRHAVMNVVVARGGRRGLEVVERLGPIAPEPGCVA
jgi:branched-chain amino acid transport system substrate-binding protein/urea transport system substrate-binding protein